MTTAIKTLGYNQNVNMAGERGFFAVFTVAGYARKNNLDVQEVVASEIAMRRPLGVIQRCSTVITDKGDGMSAWDNAVTLSVGDTIEVEGERYTVGARTQYSQDYPLTKIA